MKKIKRKLNNLHDSTEKGKDSIHLSKLFKFNRIRKIKLNKIK